MRRFVGFFAAAVIAIGTAQSATLLMTDTFDLNQAPPAGGPGPNAPSSATNANGVHALGITFSFTSPSSGITTYGQSGQAALLNSQFTDPVLFGTADGTLTLNFDFPTTFLTFDIALGPAPDSGGHVVMGSNSANFTTAGGQGQGGFFSIGRFSATPASSFTQAVITFNSNASGADFAIDNLSYNVPITQSLTPEPSSLTFLSAGVLLLGALRNRWTSARR